MLDKYKPFIAAFFVLFVCSIAYSAHHYSQKYRATQLELDKATATIGTMQKQRDDSAKLDKEHYDALQAKKNELADLQRCIAAGKCGVRIKTVYVPSTTSTGGVGDAGTCELTESARQDYLHLRELIATQEQQIRYLQGYIRTVLNAGEAGN
jgi:prophage endopeptidase